MPSSLAGRGRGARTQNIPSVTTSHSAQPPGLSRPQLLPHPKPGRAVIWGNSSLATLGAPRRGSPTQLPPPGAILAAQHRGARSRLPAHPCPSAACVDKSVLSGQSGELGPEATTRNGHVVDMETQELKPLRQPGAVRSGHGGCCPGLAHRDCVRAAMPAPTVASASVWQPGACPSWT